jgi:hypothetical protein
MYTGESEACLTVTLFCINQALIIKLLIVKPENEYEQRINFQKLFYYKKYVWGSYDIQIKHELTDIIMFLTFSMNNFNKGFNGLKYIPYHRR